MSHNEAKVFYFFELSVQRSEKMIMVSTKILSSKNCFPH